MIYQAFADDNRLITAVINRSFYNGESNSFYLYDEKMVPLEILDRTKDKEKVTYQLAVPYDLDVSREVNVVEEHGRKCVLQYRLITKNKWFEDEFAYHGELGAVYSENKTDFYLWAPTCQRVTLILDPENQSRFIPMKRFDRGVYYVSVAENLDNVVYGYQIRTGGKEETVSDPYGFGLTADCKYSIVLDPKKMEFHSDYRNCKDPIIYEASIRDFTMDANTTIEHKGKYLGFVEEGKTTKGTDCGFSYLKKLGVTHVQVLPVNEIATIDDLQPTLFYNWGYDPYSYMTIEGSYSTDPNDGYKRVYELQKMVRTLHENNLGMIYDVVFNHVYDIDNCVLNKVVPYYYFRYYPTGKPCNGSGCGNDIDTEKKMSQHLLLASLKMMIERFGADGFRFDLMGLLDHSFMNRVRELRKLRSDLLLYGEGWHMNTLLKDDDKVSIQNQARNGNIGYFNDSFREQIRNYFTMENVDGYHISNLMAGSCLNGQLNCLFDQPDRSINYLECHDDMTLYDRLKTVKEEEKISMIKGMMGCLFMAQGHPFVHSGQEFARTKHGLSNTYRSSDRVNHLDYKRKDKYSELTNYVKEMMELRKELPIFPLSKEDIQKRYRFEVIYDRTLKIWIDCSGLSEEYAQLCMIINPHSFGWSEKFAKDFKVLADHHGKKENLESNYIWIAPYSITVLAEKN